MQGEEERDIRSQDHDEVKEVVNALFERDLLPPDLKGFPLRIIPDTVAGRMLQQDSRFTLHHPGCRDFDSAVGTFICKWPVDGQAKTDLKEELRDVGVNWGSLFPDIDHLIKEICDQAGV